MSCHCVDATKTSKHLLMNFYWYHWDFYLTYYVKALNLPIDKSRGFLMSDYATRSRLVPSPVFRVLIAAFLSRSCRVPHSVHSQILTDKPTFPVGPVLAEQCEQVMVEYFDSTSAYFLPLAMHL